MKEKSHIEIREILSEISVISNIRHPNIVQLHGVEIHNTDLFLFMEYCNQGTLWSAARQGLPERMIRFYTRDLLRAVYALHQKGIVHRDIKGANIFLSDNSVKLGDFGLSVQLQNLNKTTHQEVKNQRGTIPYMAPEVVLQKNMGMPVDIWSVGCVVVEMYTNKRPWFEFEDNAFAIMYQLGQGNHPNYPEDKMNGEMVEFLNLCFQMSPKDRAGANRLLDHPFVQILDEDDDGDDDII
jgi:mitogen-activated protein kinase kinase kinase 4